MHETPFSPLTHLIPITIYSTSKSKIKDDENGAEQKKTHTNITNCELKTMKKM